MLIQTRQRGPVETETIPDQEPATTSVDAVSPGSEPARPSPQPAPPRVRDLRSMRWLAAHFRVLLVALILLGLAGGLGYTTLKLRHQDAVSRARTSALAAASTYAVDMASYDYRHLDEDFGRVKQHSTASFQAKFTQSSSALVKLLTQYHATANAKVVAAGLVSADTGRAVALVFITQHVTNTAQKSQPPDTQSRIRVTMVHPHGQWLIDNVELL